MLTTNNQRAAAATNAIIGMAGYGLLHELDLIDDGEELAFDFAQIESKIATQAHHDIAPLQFYHPDHVLAAKSRILSDYRQRVRNLDVGADDNFDIGDYDEWMRVGYEQDMLRMVIRMVEEIFNAFDSDKLASVCEHYTSYWTFQAFPKAS